MFSARSAACLMINDPYLPHTFSNRLCPRVLCYNTRTFLLDTAQLSVWLLLVWLHARHRLQFSTGHDSCLEVNCATLASASFFALLTSETEGSSPCDGSDQIGRHGIGNEGRRLHVTRYFEGDLSLVEVLRYTGVLVDEIDCFDVK